MRLISRIAVLGVPSSASRWISFNATISEVVRDRPCSHEHPGAHGMPGSRWLLQQLLLLADREHEESCEQLD